MKNCLIVDDSRVIRKVAARLVEDLALEAIEAEDGYAALEICRQKMPDVILLDGHMPNMSCPEFLRALRREPKGDTPLVVFCTNENDADEITEALGAGADEFLMKPFDRDSLEAKLTELGILAGGQREHARS